jgi:hypothetical protein
VDELGGPAVTGEAAGDVKRAALPHEDLPRSL